MAAPKSHPAVEEQLAKYQHEPMKKGAPDWTLNSRNLIAACLFGKMGMAVPRNSPKDKLPSIAAPQLAKCAHPFAGILMRWKSLTHTVGSIRGATTHIRAEADFEPKTPDPANRLARIVYVIVGFGDVERIFTKSGESVPISADKRVRYALRAINHEAVIDSSVLHEDVISMLPPIEVMNTGDEIAL